IERRMSRSTIGFKSGGSKQTEENILSFIAPADLRTFGLIPELVGRFPVLTHLNTLDANALRRILTEPKNAIIKQYVYLFELDGIALKFKADALNWIVEQALEYKLGARGLRGILETLLTDAMFEMPGTDVKELVVDKKYCVGKKGLTPNKGLKVA
ncbi:MAG TPA: ATP-dependent Clp protease ATP-binding subunit ClpX, partial [Flavobacteriales bacterium]|nr:ATP-dependent Clp protease ATP-binding subunit ClpX [Flavobacteriales bacterium]